MTTSLQVVNYRAYGSSAVKNITLLSPWLSGTGRKDNLSEVEVERWFCLLGTFFACLVTCKTQES
ncbi:hypothetical protein DPMN_175874 [Dreissena polymorpha]|uniref:Uncharacterized protein n=1 Tax=Dreissena polymorpha TaxID=45954 RepID=A0A9D4E5Z0_DREPO|nr:hypothetical protein DPMN_175874 [Dreissena polymorpha]